MKTLRVIISLIMIFLTTACSVQSPPGQTTEPKPTPTASATSTLIPPTPIASPFPISSPSPTSPTLTPAAPEGEASAYRLATQTADQADEAITRIEQRILNLENDPVPPDSPGYTPQYGPYYTAAWYAAWSALAHFSGDPRAQTWRWKMAYYMALAGDGDEAAQVYMEQIATVLNSGQVNIDQLPDWFESGQLEKTFYTPVFTLDKQPIVIPNVQDSYVLSIGKLNDIDTPGGMCLLLAKQAQKYSLYEIYNGFEPTGYNVMIRNPLSCLPKDITDDGVAEVIVDQYTGGHYGTTKIRVYNVASLPPTIMPFTTLKDENLLVWNGEIHDYPIANKHTQLQIYAPFGDLNCDNYYIRSYQWGGQWFDLSKQTLHLGIPIANEFCADMALSGLYDLNTKEATDLLAELIQTYRPHASQIGDIFNEIILRQGVNYALQGEQEKARAAIAEVVENQQIKDSVWLEPAKKFLQIYRQPADLYRACSALVSCTPYSRLESAPGVCAPVSICDTESVLDYTLTSIYPSISLDQIIAHLKKVGVPIAKDGQFDFDQDQEKELWFTLLRPQKDEYQLWIVAKSSQGNVIFNMGYYEPNVPLPSFKIAPTDPYPLAIDLGADKQFAMLRNRQTGEPTIHWLDEPDEKYDEGIKTINTNANNFRQLRQRLLAGENTALIYEQIRTIEKESASCPFEFKSQDDTTTSSYDCHAFYYTLALSAELAGKESDAVQRYYDIWKNYPDNPFATLARLMLEQR